MTAPFLVLFAVFFVAPLVYSVWLSLKAGGAGKFAGLLNYRSVISNSEYWGGVQRMIYFGVIQVTAMIGLAIALALFLDSAYCKGRKFFALVYFLPYAVPGVIAAIMWAFLLEPDLNGALNIPHKLGLASGPIDPLDYRLALYAIMLIVTWEFAGYNMTILLTSLTSVQRQVIEAARIDGCSELAIALRVKFPLIRRTVLFTVILSIIGTLQLFNEPVLAELHRGDQQQPDPEPDHLQHRLPVRQRVAGRGPVDRAGRDHDRGHRGVLRHHPAPQ